MPYRCLGAIPACLCLSLVLMIPAAAAAAPGLTVLGSGVTGRPYVLHDDIVMETTGLFEAVRDFSDVGAPAWVGWHEHAFTFHWSGVASDDGLVVAFNADPTHPPVGFSVNDFSDPAAPAERCVAAGLPVGSAWLDGRALLVAIPGAVVAYDLSEPAAPAYTGLIPVGARAGDRWFSRVDEVVYLIDQGAAVRALHVADARHPLDLGVRTVTGDRIEALAGGDGVLYGLVVTGDALDLVTWDAAAPGALAETDRRLLYAGFGASGRALVRAGELLVAATGEGRVRAFGLATPSRPDPGWQRDHDAEHVAVSAGALFVSAADGLHIYRRTGHDQAPDEPIHRTALPRFATIAGDGPLQIAQCDDDRSLLIPVDASVAAQPRLAKPIATGLGGTLQYAGGMGLMREDAEGVRLIDLGDPYAPVRRARLRLPRATSTAFLMSRDLLVLNREAPTQPAFDIYDISDADTPVLVATVLDRRPLPAGGPWLVCGAGDPGHRDDPRVYKVDGQAPPARLGKLATGLSGILHARVVDACVYLFGMDGAGKWSVEIHQMRGGLDPVRLQEFPLGMAPVQVDVVGGAAGGAAGERLFVQGSRACQVYDVSTPSAPFLVGTFALNGDAGAGFARHGDMVTVSGRLVTVRCGGGSAAAAAPRTPPAHSDVRLLPACPSPFNPGTTISFTVDRDRPLTLAVYDLRGRLVAQLAQGVFTAGAHAASWDGTARGAPAASGVYLVRLYGPGVEAVQSVVLVK